MKTAPLLAFALSALAGPVSAQNWQERPDWSHFFAEAGVKGTILVCDERSNAQWVFDRERAGKRFVPASTFKIPHALFALEAGVVQDEFQVFPWDGKEYAIKSWNQDQTLRSSMRNSPVWLYQQFARRIGEEREREYLRRIGYGNADPSGGVDLFWLNGRLQISAMEEVEFLQRLYRNALPFKLEHQRLVKDIMINEAGREWILRAKTGWSARVEEKIGWWVGWVEWPDGAVFFALNIDMPGDGADAPKRESITRAILRSIKALPAE
jgi:beta-lactamase class D